MRLLIETPPLWQLIVQRELVPPMSSHGNGKSWNHGKSWEKHGKSRCFAGWIRLNPLWMGGEYSLLVERRVLCILQREFWQNVGTPFINPRHSLEPKMGINLYQFNMF